MLEQDVLRVQIETQDRWTLLYNRLSFVMYPKASPLRVLRHALREHRAFDPPPRRILEYGFGHGNALFSFAPPAALYGVELSDLALSAATERARKMGYREYAFKKARCQDSVNIDFGPNEFDLVLCSHTIEHVYDDERLVAELYRVLKPGGRIFLLAPLDVHSTRDFLSREDRRRHDFPETSFHVWQYNLATLEGLMRNAGFEIIQAVELDAIWDWRLSWNRPLQVFTSLLFAVTPYRIWRWLDELAARLGHRYTQGLVVAFK